MPECKWCMHFKLETRANWKDDFDNEWKCQIGKIDQPSPTDSCGAWELDEAAAEEHEERAKDEYQQQEQLRRGDA